MCSALVCGRLVPQDETAHTDIENRDVDPGILATKKGRGATLRHLSLVGASRSVISD